MFDEIRSNKRRSVALIATFVVITLAIGVVVGVLIGGGPVPSMIALVIASVMAFTSYWKSDQIALRVSRAVPADPVTYQRLHNLVEGLCIASGLPKPRVYVIDDPAPNAFATGRNPQHAAITVTSGLLAAMSTRELRGVIAHETGHIVNRDIAVTTLAVLAVGAIAVIAEIGIRVGIFGGTGRRNDAGAIFLLVGLALYIIAVPAGMLLRAALSRRRESMADATAVELTREPAGIRSALEKLEADTTVVARPSAATAHLWIESPMDRDTEHGLQGAFGRMMDTHPPLAQRIAVLRAIEGLDPDGRGPNDPAPS